MSDRSYYKKLTARVFLWGEGEMTAMILASRLLLLTGEQKELKVWVQVPLTILLTQLTSSAIDVFSNEGEIHFFLIELIN